MADAEKLKIAFFNILINAVEAVDDSIGHLQISIESKPHYVILLLKDNGNGIAEENLTRIFEPYFTSKSNGFGLGLSTAPCHSSIPSGIGGCSVATWQGYQFYFNDEKSTGRNGIRIVNGFPSGSILQPILYCYRPGPFNPIILSSYNLIVL